MGKVDLIMDFPRGDAHVIELEFVKYPKLGKKFCSKLIKLMCKE
jgi:hypothetical protein